MATQAGCELCEQDGGLLVWRGEKLRVIRALDAHFPAFYRVVWTDHVAEWTDLAPPDRSHLMQTVAKVEAVMREVLHPTKINLASLGNVVPHLHWHVIARFADDSHFPNPIWGEKRRDVAPGQLAALQAAMPALDQALAGVLAAG